MAPLLLLLILALVACAAAYNQLPSFNAKDFTTYSVKRVEGSRVGEINVPFVNAKGEADFVKVTRLDLVGNSKERGFAHGALLAHQIKLFTGPQLDKYFADELLNIDIR